MPGISVLSYTGGRAFLSHHIDLGFNEEWRWKGRRERNQCIFHTSSWYAYYLDSRPTLSKVLFIYVLLFSLISHKGREQ